MITALKAWESKQNLHDLCCFIANKIGEEKGEVVGCYLFYTGSHCFQFYLLCKYGYLYDQTAGEPVLDPSNM